MSNIEAIVQDVAARYALAKKNGRFAGSCPECGGSKQSDKFSFYLDGGFRCFSCDFRGDIITWLRKKEDRTCPEAHEQAGVACRAETCQVRGTCRMGDGSGKRQALRPRPIAPRANVQATDLPLTIVKSPQAVWRDWAEALIELAVPRLQDNDEVLAWLAQRGITRQAADRYGLGWLDHDRRVKRAAIGLPPRHGKTELWVPGGLLISIYDDNRIHRCRIRRPAEARARFLEDLKYVWLEGSGNEPLVLRPTGRIRGAVIIEAELDGIAVAVAHDQVLVIAIGSVSTGLPPLLRAELATLPVILVVLDADPGKNGKAGAGPAAILRWQTAYRQAKFWPVPQGKDPGHYAELGGNLRAWIEAGLVPALPKNIASHDLVFSPVGSTPGGGGVPEKSIEKNLKPAVIICSTPTGNSPSFPQLVAEQGDRMAQALNVPGALLSDSSTESPIEPEPIPGLQWCLLCDGDRFWAGTDGGFFCLTCQPVTMPGRLVRATVPRREYVVD